MNNPTSRAKIILDSISPGNVRLTTFECEYPRYQHPDMLTHRILSRNGRSSRAEPVKKVIQRGYDDPVEPLVWMYDEKRMSHGSIMNQEDSARSSEVWHKSRLSALGYAQELLSIGLHRQYLNRIIEPYVRIKMIYTSTSWANFFNLRMHPSPMPEIQQLAVTMGRLLKQSEPRRLAAGEWHLPYVTPEEAEEETSERLLILSSARCARISYDSLDGKPKTFEDEKKVYDQLMNSDPKHASPTENQGMATGDPNIRSGNFQGWIQYRHTIRGESVTDRTFDLDARLMQFDGVDYLI